jgi:hypothetical protein
VSLPPAAGKLHIPHPRPTKRQREAVQPLASSVAEAAPVHLHLFAQPGLEADECPLPALDPSRRDRRPHLYHADAVAALADLLV